MSTPINPTSATEVMSTRLRLEKLKMTIPQGVSLRTLDAHNTRLAILLMALPKQAGEPYLSRFTGLAAGNFFFPNL